MTAIIDTLNHAYGVEEGRSWWKVRLIAIALTIGGALFVLASFALVIMGPQLAEPLADALGLGTVLEWTWRILELPLACALAGIGISMVYYFAPDVDQEWSWLAPGTIFATIAVARGIPRLPLLRYQRDALHRDVWCARWGNGAAAVVLHLRLRSSARRGDEREDRTRGADREEPR